MTFWGQMMTLIVDCEQLVLVNYAYNGLFLFNFSGSYYFHEYHVLMGWHSSTRKEGNVLFNDTLNTFYLRLYGVSHIVKDHSDSDRGNPLPHIGYSFRLAARVLLYASSHRQDNTYHSFVTPVVEHWLNEK